MCKVGDIIVVDCYKTHGTTLPHHSFIVLNDENGTIRGLDYNIVGLVMSSFHSEDHKKKKMSYPGNFPIVSDDKDVEVGNVKSGYVKTEQFYYFDKDKISYKIIGILKKDIFNLLIEFIEESDLPIEQITDNL